MLEAIGFSLLLVLSIRTKNMSDRLKIEKIFEYTRLWVVAENGERKKCKFIKKNDLGDGIGTAYTYRLPLGLPYIKLKHLNDNIGVFEDGLHKNVELDFKGGMLYVYVYENELPRKLNFSEVVKKKQKVLYWRAFDNKK